MLLRTVRHWQEAKLLEDHRRRRAALGPITLEVDRARARPGEPGDDVEERGLARARRAEERDELLRLDRDAHGAERLEGLAPTVRVRLRDPVDDDAHR